MTSSAPLMPGLPVRSGNAFEETMEHLLRTLRLGRFAPGSKLPPERELAESLGVSRTTLRDALAQLQEAGFVDVRRGRYGGTYVHDVLPLADVRHQPPPSPAEVEDVLTLRLVVEPAAAGLAARRAALSVKAGRVGVARGLSETDREALVAAHEAVAQEGTHHENLGRYRPLDSRFHLQVAELSGTPSLVEVVAQVRARVNELLDRIPLLPPNLKHSSEQHGVVVGAILGGRPAAAEEAMRDHLEGTNSLLRGFLT